ncbi:MAG TPA: DUF1146 domain-containing protein [Acholeplasmataceae bacterium]|nr:DUF1146 domain-containing protein [Acholeplasmataceae bacterium]
MIIADLIAMWYFIIFFGLIPIIYRALMAIDFSKFFRYNSTWQIRLLVMFFSIIISFLLSFAFTYTLEKLYSVVIK